MLATISMTDLCKKSLTDKHVQNTLLTPFPSRSGSAPSQTSNAGSIRQSGCSMSPESAGGLAEIKQSAVQTPCALKALEAQRRSDGERNRWITFF